MSRILRLEDIEFMNWGIITKFNFREEYADYIPLKRWDPLTSTHIRLYDEAEKKFYFLDKRRGNFSYISPVRAVRPQGGKKEGKTGGKDIFKEIIEGKDYAIFITLDEEPWDGPFSLTPEKLDVRDRRAVTIINRYPAMARYIDPDIREEISRIVEDEYTKISFGINLVTVTTHYSETLSDAPPSQIAAILASMKSAIKYITERLRSEGYEIIPVYSFFNIGLMAGGSQPRLHSQVYIDLNQDGHGVFMENLLQAFEEHRKTGGCYLCRHNTHGTRVIYEDDMWIAWATSSPRRNYHVRLAPKRHVMRYTDLDYAELESLAIALHLISRSMDMAGVVKDRNILIYSNPYGYGGDFHIFIDFIPFERIGGIEMLDTVRVARLHPRKVARKLREGVEKIALKSHDLFL